MRQERFNVRKVKQKRKNYKRKWIQLKGNELKKSKKNTH